MFICSHVKAPIDLSDLSERGNYIKGEYFIIIDLIGVMRGAWEIFSRVAIKGLQNYGEFSQSASLWMKLYKHENKSTALLHRKSIFDSKHTNITMLYAFTSKGPIDQVICFHVKGPIDLSEGMYYLKYFIISDLIGVTWGLGEF